MAVIQLTADAKEDLADLDPSVRQVVVKALRKLETEPEKRGQPLGGSELGKLTGFRKLVVGDRGYRIVYRVENPGGDPVVVVVTVIAARADDRCYQLAVARLSTYGNQPAAEEMTQLIAGIWGRNSPP